MFCFIHILFCTIISGMYTQGGRRHDYRRRCPRLRRGNHREVRQGGGGQPEQGDGGEEVIWETLGGGLFY